MDYEYEKAVTRRTFEKYLDMIEKHTRRGKMFELGAATGYFLMMAEERGWVVSGAEISSYAANKAQEKGLQVSEGGPDVLNAYHDEFDAIILLDVFEHLLYPALDLEKMAEAIKSGGVLVLAMPDRGSLFAKILGPLWHAIVPPQHTFLYTRKNLTHFLKRYGFEVIDERASGKWFTVQYLFRVLHTWLGWRPLFWLADRTAGTRLGRISFPLNLRDTMFVVARKRG
jgi:SAM-dependent methyltransferase